MKTVVFHREAELRAGIAYYEGQREGLGMEFQEEIEEAVVLIAQVPQAFSPYGSEGMRKYVIRRFPYSVYYMDLPDAIWIAAVAHTSRRPGYWKNRTPE